MQKGSRLGLFLFILNFNVLTMRVFIFPYLYQEFGVMSYLYILIMIFSLGVLFLVIPKRVYEFDFTEKYKNSRFKLFYNVLLIIKVILTIYIASLIIKEIDYISYNIFYFIVGITISALLVSRLKNSEIIEISTWIVMIAIVLYMLAFLHTVDFDTSLIRVFDFKLPKFALYLLIIMIYCDNLLLLLTNKERYQFKKSTIILPIILQFIFLSFELFQLIFSVGETFFLDYEWVGFVSLSFQDVSDYIGNLDFVYLYICTMASVLNTSYVLSTIRHSLNKAKLSFDIIVFILVIGGCYGLIFVPLGITLKILFYISILGGVLIFWIGREYIHARKAR